jgi:N-acetylglucosaminyl-diphospho-decaprenol L-rhamnosyltransferase
VVLVYGPGPERLAIVEDLIRAGIPRGSLVAVRNPDGTGRTASVPEGVHVVDMPSNGGYATGMNAGIAAALAGRPEWILLCTHDVSVPAPDLEALLAAGDGEPSFGVLGPALALLDGQPYSYGGRFGADGGVWHAAAPPDGDGPVRPQDWIDGSVILLRAAAIATPRVFEEGFFMYFEDAELCAEARRAGWGVGVVPGAIARTAPGGTRRRAAYEYLLARNGLQVAREVGGRPLARRAALRRVTVLTRRQFECVRSRTGRRQLGSEITAAASALLGMAHYLAGRWGPPPAWLLRHGDIGAVAAAPRTAPGGAERLRPRRAG